jgi:hypothetical protein
VVSSLIVLPLLEDELLCLWILDLSSFEPVHGLSRILMLIPDKLATALSVNRENYAQHSGDFLIKIGHFLLS